MNSPKICTGTGTTACTVGRKAKGVSHHKTWIQVMHEYFLQFVDICYKAGCPALLVHLKWCWVTWLCSPYSVPSSCASDVTWWLCLSRFGWHVSPWQGKVVFECHVQKYSWICNPLSKKPGHERSLYRSTCTAGITNYQYSAGPAVYQLHKDWPI